jgi:uncharacterized membrane protein
MERHMEHETESRVIAEILDVIEYVAVGIEILAVAIIVVGIVWATYVFLARYRAPRAAATEYDRYRVRLGRTLLLGLEILVAADVVRTVALDSTLEGVAVLGLLVLIRTFLSWSLAVEIDNRWPWQRPEIPETGAPGTRDANAGNPRKST